MTINTDLKIYLVGGAVRDEILAQPISDRDWVVIGSTPKTMQEMGYRPVGNHFPVFIHPQSREEYALARTERKESAGHQGFSFNTSPEVTLEQDLLRRDITINAMAKDCDGVIIDPYGGQQDIEARLLRHVSPAFAEDPLRVLRVARFSARFSHLGFSVASDTLNLMRQISQSGELSSLSAERVAAELQTALSYKDPQPFFSTLRACDALAELFPELDALYGVPQVAEHHPEIDCGIHNELVLQQIGRVSDNPVAKYAALCHDLGKATTPKDILPSHHGHEERGADIAQNLSERLRLPNDYRRLAVMTARYHTHCHRALELKSGTILKLLSSLDALRRPEHFEIFLQVCEADARGRQGFDNRLYPQAEYLRKALKELATVEAGSIASEAQQSGKDVAEEIHRARLSAIKCFVSKNKPADQS